MDRLAYAEVDLDDAYQYKPFLLTKKDKPAPGCESSSSVDFVLVALGFLASLNPVAGALCTAFLSRSRTSIIFAYDSVNPFEWVHTLLLSCSRTLIILTGLYRVLRTVSHLYRVFFYRVSILNGLLKTIGQLRCEPVRMGLYLKVAAFQNAHNLCWVLPS